MKSIRLVGVLLIVYLKECHVGHVQLIDTDSVPTGIMGMLVSRLDFNTSNFISQVRFPDLLSESEVYVLITCTEL